MIQVYPIPHTRINEFWSVAWPLIKRVYARTNLGNLVDPASLKSMLKDRQLQLWVEFEDGKVTASGLTQVTETVLGRICTALAVGSDDQNHDWAQITDMIERWAFEVEGCQAVLVNGRKGWERKLKAQGYEFDSVTLIKVKP